MEEKTGWREQNESQIVGEEKWQTCRCCRDQQRACRMAQASVEKLEHTGPGEKGKSGLSATQTEQLASVPEPPSPKAKRNRAICPEDQIMRGERVKVSESITLARERKIRWRA